MNSQSLNQNLNNDLKIPKHPKAGSKLKRVACFEFDAELSATNLAAISLRSLKNQQDFEDLKENSRDFLELSKKSLNPIEINTEINENVEKTEENSKQDTDLKNTIEIKQNSIDDIQEQQKTLHFKIEKPTKLKGNLKIPEIFAKTSLNNEKSKEISSTKHNLKKSSKERRKTQQITSTDVLQITPKPIEQKDLNNIESSKPLNTLNITLNPLYLTDYKSQITQNLPSRSIKILENSKTNNKTNKSISLFDSQESLSLSVKEANFIEYTQRITENLLNKNLKYQSKSQDNLSVTKEKLNLNKSSISSENIVVNREYSLCRNNKTNNFFSTFQKENYAKMKLRSKSVDNIESMAYNLANNTDHSKSVSNIDGGFNSNELTHNLSKSLDNIDSSTTLNFEQDLKDFKTVEPIKTERLTETLNVLKTKIPLKDLNKTLQMSVDSLEAYEDARESWPNNSKDLETSDYLEDLTIELNSPAYDYHNLMKLKKSKTSYRLESLDKTYSFESESNEEDNFISACNTLESKWSQKPPPQPTSPSPTKTTTEHSKKTKTFRVKTTEKLITLTQMAQHNVSHYATYRKSKNFCKNASKSFKNSLKFYENFSEKSLEKINKSPMKRSISLTENALKRAELNRKVFAEKSEKFIRKVRNLDGKDSPTENSDSFEYFETEDGRIRKRKNQFNKNTVTENVDENFEAKEEKVSCKGQVKDRESLEKNVQELQEFEENINLKDYPINLNHEENVSANELAKLSKESLDIKENSSNTLIEKVASHNSNENSLEVHDVKVNIFNSQRKSSLAKLKRLASLEIEVNNIDKDLAALCNESLSNTKEELKENTVNSLESTQRLKEYSGEESLNSKELKTKANLDEVPLNSLNLNSSNIKTVSSNVNFNISPRPFKRFGNDDEDKIHLKREDLNIKLKPTKETLPVKFDPSINNLQRSTTNILNSFSGTTLLETSENISEISPCLPDSLARFHSNKVKFNVYSSTPTKIVRPKTSLDNSKSKKNSSAANCLGSELTPLVVTSATISTVSGMGFMANSFGRTPSFSSSKSFKLNSTEKLEKEENSKVVEQITDNSLKLRDDSLESLEKHPKVFENSFSNTTKNSENLINDKEVERIPELLPVISLDFEQPLCNPFNAFHEGNLTKDSAVKESLSSNPLYSTKHPKNPPKIPENCLNSSHPISNIETSLKKSLHSTLTAEGTSKQNKLFSTKTFTAKSSSNSQNPSASKMEINLLELSSISQSNLDKCLLKNAKFFESNSQQFKALSPKKPKCENSLNFEANFKEKSTSFGDLTLNFQKSPSRFSENLQISKSCSELVGNSTFYRHQIASPVMETFVRGSDSHLFSFNLIRFSQNSPKVIDGSNDDENLDKSPSSPLKAQTYVGTSHCSQKLANYTEPLQNSCLFKEYHPKSLSTRQVSKISQNFQENTDKISRIPNSIAKSLPKIDTDIFHLMKFSQNSSLIPDNALSMDNLNINQNYSSKLFNNSQINGNFVKSQENLTKRSQISSNLCNLSGISSNQVKLMPQDSDIGDGKRNISVKLESFVRNPNATRNSTKFLNDCLITNEVSKKISQNSEENTNFINANQLFAYPSHLGNIAQFPINASFKERNATTCSDTLLTSNTFNSAPTQQLNKTTTTTQLILNKHNDNNFNKTPITTFKNNNNNTPPPTTTTTTSATTPILKVKDFNETSIKVTTCNTITTNTTISNSITTLTTNFPTKVVALSYNNSTNISDKNSSLYSCSSSSRSLLSTTSFLNDTLAIAKYQQKQQQQLQLQPQQQQQIPKIATTTANISAPPLKFSTTKNPPNVLPRRIFNNATTATTNTTTLLKSCKTTISSTSNVNNFKNNNNNAPPLPPLRRRIPGNTLYYV